MDYLVAIERDAVALLDAARSQPSAPVLTCPGWDMTALVGHTGGAHRWAINAVLQDEPGRPDFELPPDEGVFEWFEEGVQELIAVLRSADPAKSVWTFDRNDRTPTFWARRQAHETAVHRADAEVSVGRAITPADAALAVDGINEALTVFVPMVAKRGADVPSTGQSVHLHATDAEGEWLIAFDGVPTVTTGHAKGDAAVRGTASDLYFWLWGRSPLDRLEVFGDAEAVARLRALTTF